MLFKLKMFSFFSLNFTGCCLYQILLQCCALLWAVFCCANSDQKKTNVFCVYKHFSRKVAITKNKNSQANSWITMINVWLGNGGGGGDSVKKCSVC